ncbi:TetR/AcrR family transcriptional regulator [Nocardia cyriacigeorgica]|uniref:TetR/AcrR family transcriptional regulator n=1 Tax=Nocardia cyriacigeorgica TaxID=135487 RepID=UPI00245595BF|nr:TetR/AcrR family transcriptional regulator [Nocardia cyriacigeorgica]
MAGAFYVSQHSLCWLAGQWPTELGLRRRDLEGRNEEMADRRAETTRESRRLLIDAAAGLFVEKGYQQTTFADVAARSGVSRGSIPWHFGNKEGLLIAVLDEAGETLLAGTDAMVAEGSPNPAPDLLARVKQPEIARLSLLFVTLFVEAADPASPIHGKYAELHQRLRRTTERWVDAHIRLPDGVRADGLAAILVGAAIGIHVQAAMEPGVVTVDDMAEQLEGLIRPFLIEQPPR